MAGITVVARMKARSGMEEQVKASLLALVGPSRSDAGCVSYDLHQSPEDEALFLFYENWASKEDLNRHLGKPHLRAFLERADALLDEPVSITFWDKIT